MDTLYDRIRSRRIELGMTVEELAAKMGYKDKSSISKIENGKADIPQSKVVAFARALETSTAYLMGLEERRSNLPENMSPLPRMREWPVIGATACGTPLHRETFDETVFAPDDIKADMVFRCVGDSMINARIFDGDAVFVRAQPEVENGQIAVVRVDDEYTLKRVYVHSDYVELRPENPTFKAIILREGELDPDNFEIVGLAVAFLSPVS